MRWELTHEKGKLLTHEKGKLLTHEKGKLLIHEKGKLLTHEKGKLLTHEEFYSNFYRCTSYDSTGIVGNSDSKSLVRTERSQWGRWGFGLLHTRLGFLDQKPQVPYPQQTHTCTNRIGISKFVILGFLVYSLGLVMLETCGKRIACCRVVRKGMLSLHMKKRGG